MADKAIQMEKEMEVEKAGPTVVVVDQDNENNNNNGGSAAATGIGAACACCLTCCGFVVGIPLFIAGAVFVSPLLAWISWSVGVGAGCIVVGILLFVGAIVACVLTGCCAAKASQPQQVAPQQTAVVVVQDVPPTEQY